MPTERLKAKVFVVDDHPLMRDSLRTLIDLQPDLVTCGEADDIPKALREIGAKSPDIAIVDISLKGGSGLELIKALRARGLNVAILVLSMHDEKQYAERAIRAGARGYVMKGESTKQIVFAIRQVRQGKLYVSESVRTSFAERFVQGQNALDRSPVEALSDRELEVFNLIGNGIETRQIAEDLHVSIKTVQAYCARIKQKLGLSSATELLREAVRWNEQSLRH